MKRTNQLNAFYRKINIHFLHFTLYDEGQHSRHENFGMRSSEK